MFLLDVMLLLLVDFFMFINFLQIFDGNLMQDYNLIFFIGFFDIVNVIILEVNDMMLLIVVVMQIMNLLIVLLLIGVMSVGVLEFLILGKIVVIIYIFNILMMLILVLLIDVGSVKFIQMEVVRVRILLFIVLMIKLLIIDVFFFIDFMMLEKSIIMMIL